uniref:L1 transposable element RRM domain-containing protein n=1 Tax=Myripristis murdjan TaxID=586833 RepID=A0A667YFF8_9TELE
MVCFQYCMDGDNGTGAEAVPPHRSSSRKNLRGAHRMSNNQTMAGDMEKILQAIEASKKELLTNLQGIESKVINLELSMSNLADQNAAMEERVSKTEDDLAAAQNSIKKLETTVATLQSKVDYMENKSRQSNLLIVGVPEGSEGADTGAFLKRLIPGLLGADNFPEPIAVERSHRIAVRNRGDPQKSRPIIAKFQNYQDKLKILRLSREHRELRFKDRRIYFFPDYSEAVQAKRKAFLPVKKKFQSRGIRYAMLFPAVLSIDYEGTKSRFYTPKAAEDFLRVTFQGRESDSSMEEDKEPSLCA